MGNIHGKGRGHEDYCQVSGEQARVNMGKTEMGLSERQTRESRVAARIPPTKLVLLLPRRPLALLLIPAPPLCWQSFPSCMAQQSFWPGRILKNAQTPENALTNCHTLRLGAK